MAYSNATQANANYLASKTGLNPTVTMAWLKNEQQSTPNPTNPLNIRAGGAPGQTGTSGGFATYASPQAGLDAAAWLVNNSSHYTGIRNVVSSGGSAYQQARAIEQSPWAAGHYGQSGISSMLDTAPFGNTPSGQVAPGTYNPATGNSGDPVSIVTNAIGSALATPVYFIGVILVGITLILVGGIVTLKPGKMAQQAVPVLAAA